ncbi:MAG TPA: MBOAT family O-acyltransferase, partial [Thermoanaerobaculia bacterium]|nr:MBOAT family O-acyltransferase [Thermoanaerobaculia bacterium]
VPWRPPHLRRLVTPRPLRYDRPEESASPPPVVFSSTVFLFAFLPVVLALYYALGRRAWNGVLLASSLFFYAWGEQLIVVLMLASILANYAFGLWIDRSRRTHQGKAAITTAIVFNVLLLVLFKYSDWIWENASAALGHPHPSPLGSHLVGNEFFRAVFLTPDGHIRLPVGISFFTFHALSYVIDVHRGDGVVQRNPSNFGLYIALFPQLIAGPIIRYRDVDLQILSREVRVSKFASGVRRFVVGLGKKALVANVAGEMADSIFAAPRADVTFAVAWLGILVYALQIYFDFSGYSDMAIGLGRMFGFEFVENFNYPYISKSITEFWRRWHISLSTWFRDYLYIPMGGNRVSRARTYLHLVTVFFLCGLWHGAKWNFVFFGLHHGAFLVIERMGLGAWMARRSIVLRRAYTLLVVVLGWVYFRIEDLGLAGNWLAAMFGFQRGTAALQYPSLYLDAFRILVFCAAVVGSTPWVPSLSRWIAARKGESARSRFLPVAVHVALLAVFLVSVMQVAAGTYNPFIYFRF